MDATERDKHAIYKQIGTRIIAREIMRSGWRNGQKNTKNGLLKLERGNFGHY